MAQNIEKKIIQTIDRLKKEHPIFHSEADFQHQFSHIFHQLVPHAKLRLERRMDLGDDKRSYVDMWIEIDRKTYVIELKYKTAKFKTVINGEEFDLLDQGARPIGRYNFFKDVERLEKIAGKGSPGFAIMITNDPMYLKDSEKESIDREFRIYDGRQVSGNLSWGPNTGEGTKKGREKDIVLKNSYRLNWENYSVVEGMDFKVLIVKVT